MKKKFELIKEVLPVIVLIVIIISVSVFAILVKPYDELWNFANSYKIFNGYKMYEEVNIIITPLFFWIAQMFFEMFGATILTFRIYNMVILTMFFVLIYSIFKSLNIVRRRAIFYTFFLIIMVDFIIKGGANYNVLAIIPILITIDLILRGKDNSIILGTLLFLSFMIKQNVFVFFAISILIYKIVSKTQIKKMIFDLLKIYTIAGVEIGIFLFYLYLNGNLYNFINYCFLGITEFGTQNIGIEISGIGYIFISILAIIFSCIIIHYKKKLKMDEIFIRNIKYLLSFGVIIFFISYPIFNKYHTSLGSIINYINIIYIIDNLLIKNLQLERKKEKYAYVFIIMFYIIIIYYFGINRLISGVEDGKYLMNLDGAFYGGIIEKTDYKNIKKICSYIEIKEKEGYNIKVLSYKANLYMTMLNKNNGMFDLAFLGNLGKDGETGLIQEIDELNNSLILIETDENNTFYQESERVRNYIKDNYKMIGNIEEYSIYYIK